jgi:hypothetical protein
MLSRKIYRQSLSLARNFSATAASCECCPGNGGAELPYLEAETREGWRLEIFEDAGGRFYPRRWISAPADPSGGRIDVTPGLQNYAFETADAAMEHAYRERRQRELLSSVAVERDHQPKRPSGSSS